LDAYVRFVPNPDFAREIDRQAEFRAGKVRIAEEVAGMAKAIAPKRTGTYARSLGVHVVGPAVYVRSTDWKAGLLEYGTNDTPTFATIRRAALQNGLRLDEAERNRIGQRGFTTVIRGV
jgi:hypothetical protein